MANPLNKPLINAPANLINNDPLFRNQIPLDNNHPFMHQQQQQVYLYLSHKLQ